MSAALLIPGLQPYYSDERVALFHADCRDILPLLDDGCVAHVITDPPYSEHVHQVARSRRMLPTDRGRRGGADVRRRVELGFGPLTAELRQLAAIQFARLATRWVMAFSDVEGAHRWRGDLSAAGLDYVRTGAWVKLGCTPQFSGDRPAAGFEAITICHRRGRKRWNGGGRPALWQAPIVLDRGHRGSRMHATQKPLQLMSALVEMFSDPGELILDPFAGAATTLVAAKSLGRLSIGIEDDERSCELAARRLAQGSLIGAP